MNYWNMSNEELLKQFIEAHQRMENYVFHSDWVKWTQELEDEAIREYLQIQEEILKRMKD